MSNRKHAIDVPTLFTLEGKTALVTGGSRGIGLMIARGYLESGATVYISSRKKDVCDEVAAELSAVGPCFSIPADIATSEGRKSLVTELSEREDELSILVNNAGANWGASLEEYPDSAFDKVMALNVKAVFALTRDLLPLLEQAGKPEDPARVVNVGSMDGLQVPVAQQTGTFAYSASKAAVHHLTRTLSIDLAPRNITVNAIAPGFFRTKMSSVFLEEYADGVRQECPLGRVGLPAEMAGIAIYLASRAGAYTNGAVIPVDGGTHLSKKGP
ncbi:MAG: SDR family oxidoreductase [Proteobacteria bacterium]|nr:SDR family oxidoreductase [Pseudomonadota bacterium]